MSIKHKELQKLKKQQEVGSSQVIVKEDGLSQKEVDQMIKKERARSDEKWKDQLDRSRTHEVNKLRELEVKYADQQKKMLEDQRKLQELKAK